MGFKGTFSRTRSVRQQGNIDISFTLKCTNLFLSEKVDIGFFPSNGNQPWFWRDVVLKPGNQYDFNYDTENIEWYNHDRIAILDRKGTPIPKYTWELNLRVYGPGECPQCHGTRVCRVCNGSGFHYVNGNIANFENCPVCGGTGKCQECDVPTREPDGFNGGPRVYDSIY